MSFRISVTSGHTDVGHHSILDRNNFTNARLGGIEDDLGLTDHQYNTGLMIMYVGYLLFQLPSNVILSKFPRPGLYLSVAAALWGCVSEAAKLGDS